VVMQRSKLRVLYGYSLTAKQQEKMRRRVENVVRALHQEGFVHGDIRDTNILVDPETLGSDDVAIHIVDLDWAGQIGEARYPLGINTTTVKRPAGVRSGELITPQHDLDMISYLFQ
jgi:RIO-like serine/threonine protein kinase